MALAMTLVAIRQKMKNHFSLEVTHSHLATRVKMVASPMNVNMIPSAGVITFPIADQFMNTILNQNLLDPSGVFRFQFWFAP